MDVEGFHASALSFNFSSLPTYISLKEKTSQSSGASHEILVRTLTGDELESTLVKFDVTKRGKDLLVDFSTPQKLLDFDQNLLLSLGGQYTARKANAKWTSAGTPAVRKVQQDRDTVVVDVAYPVSQAVYNGSTYEDVEKTGNVVLRFFLKRRNSLDLVTPQRTLKQGYDLNMGYFAGSRQEVDSESNAPIRKFNIANGQKITFYLKDFPTRFYSVAEEAILLWNRAFSGNVVEVKPATADMDIGDPRYNVMKWVVDGDAALGWAGTAGPTFADPLTGTVFSGGVLINGDYLVNAYRNIHRGSRITLARVGGLVLEAAGEETPILPPFTKDVDFDEYIDGYYAETITHEIGHVLGLMHNFKGNVNPVEVDGVTPYSNSIMEYLPRKERSENGIGQYDINAIEWGYYGVEPTVKVPYCTHGFKEDHWDCLRGDSGDPITYTAAGLSNVAKVLSTVPEEELTTFSFRSMKTQIENALIIYGQTTGERERTEAEKSRVVRSIYDFCDVSPAKGLSADEKKVAAANIKNLKDTVWTSILTELDDRPESKFKDYKTFFENRCFPDAVDLRKK